MWFAELNQPIVLSAKGAAAFRAGAGSLSDTVGWEKYEDVWDGIGVRVFDTLTQGQKQAAILMVTRALVDPNCPPPR
jgi:hypothetical protein